MVFERRSKFGALLAGICLLAGTSFVLFSNKVHAQDTGQPITLSVSPQLLDITANPGEEITNTFRLTNASKGLVRIEVDARNFLPSGEEGSVELTEDDTSYSIANWIKSTPSSVSMKENSTQDFEVSINVPENAEPGSHFGAIVFRTVPPEDDTAAALVSQEIAPVILVRIAGDTTESAQISEFKSSQTFLSSQKSIDFISRIENTGSVHFKPTGVIVIRDMFGNEIERLSLDQQNVLPGFIRKFTTNWNDFGFRVGRYTAELTIVTGEDDSIQTSKTSFVIFPYQVILPLLIIGVGILFILYKGRRRIVLALKALSGKEDK